MLMQIRENVSLKDFSSMRLGGNCRYLIEINTKDELIEALNWIKDSALPYRMIGGGYNIIWKDEGFNGVLLVNKILSVESRVFKNTKIKIRLGAGETWDNTVEKFTSEGFSGIECLSFIPGNCGSAVIQNIGAYGVEISGVIESVEVYDTKLNQFTIIDKNDCGFSYRDSRFKSVDKNRFLIIYVNIILEKKNPTGPYYEAIALYLSENERIQTITPTVLRDIVIAVRQSKLPDPEIIPNVGSFFYNPVIDRTIFDKLLIKFPEMKNWPIDERKVKISAGWLIDNVGYRHKYDNDKFDPKTGMATWSFQRLTLVNRAAKSTADLLKFKQEIVDKVHNKFGIFLEQEPELLP